MAVYLPNEIAQTTVTVADDVIAEIGDAFERQPMPRPNTYFPVDVAALETDRQLAANGIATAYHAITLGWEPGLRDVAHGRMLMEAIQTLAPRLLVENRVQLRWETFAYKEAAETIEWALGTPLTPSIAFNDHTSMTMRAFELSIQDRPFEHSPDSLDDDRIKQRTSKKASRSGLDEDAYVALLGKVWDRRGDVQGDIAKIAKLGRAAGAPMLSQDDTQAETRS